MEKIKLSQFDKEKIENIKFELNIFGCFILVLFLASISLFFIGLLHDNSYYFWSISFVFPVIIGVLSYKSDSKELESETFKYAGILKITSKYIYDDTNFFEFDNELVSEIKVPDNIYKDFNEGDTISLEVTEKTKKILLIQKLTEF